MCHYQDVLNLWGRDGVDEGDCAVHPREEHRAGLTAHGDSTTPKATTNLKLINGQHRHNSQQHQRRRWRQEGTPCNMQVPLPHPPPFPLPRPDPWACEQLPGVPGQRVPPRYSRQVKCRPVLGRQACPIQVRTHGTVGPAPHRTDVHSSSRHNPHRPHNPHSPLAHNPYGPHGYTHIPSHRTRVRDGPGHMQLSGTAVTFATT